MNKTPRQQRGQARVKLPERHQVEMQLMSLDQMVRDDDLVRTVVKYAESIDLSDLYDQIDATTDNVGRDAIDPRILFSLWLFATLEGINSARRIATLTTRDVAYMWICGGVSVNYHTLSDFRKDNAKLLDNILTDSIAVLHRQGLVQLQTIAQDGMRVRASAGSGSFRTQESLEKSREKAQQFVEEVAKTQDDDDVSAGSKAARKRAADEKLERIEAAGEELEEMHRRYDQRNKHKSSEHHRSAPRASTTDPEARRMKMGDNGFRPAYNVQFANDADALLIISVDVTNEGSDAGLLASMYDDVCGRYDTVPEQYLADGGFSKKEGVTHVERNGTKFYGVLHNEKKQVAEGKNPYEKRSGENAHYTAFRERMGTEEAKAIYERRAAAAEFPNANCRNQGLQQFSVRGLAKAKAQSLWHAIAYNFRRFMNLQDSQRNQSYLEILMM